MANGLLGRLVFLLFCIATLFCFSDITTCGKYLSGFYDFLFAL